MKIKGIRGAKPIQSVPDDSPPTRRERPAWFYFGPLYLFLLPFIIAALIWGAIWHYLVGLF